MCRKGRRRTRKDEGGLIGEEAGLIGVKVGLIGEEVGLDFEQSFRDFVGLEKIRKGRLFVRLSNNKENRLIC